MAATPWLDDVEMEAWMAYVETFVDLGAALEADLAVHDLTMGDYQVLVYLSGADARSMRMCDLASRLQLSPSGLTRRLDGLVRNGFVARRPSDEDRRVMLAVLTAEGMAKLRRAAPTHVRSVRDRFIDRVQRRDLPAVARSFSAVRDGLDAQRRSDQAAGSGVAS